MSSTQLKENRIDVRSSDLTVKGIADWVDNDIVDTDPAFQRRDRWDQDRQSALIESFLLGLPVPPVYLKREKEGPYTVIDGKQRITAIHSFMTGSFTLSNLKIAKELNGQGFKDLPKEYKRALEVEPAVRVVTVDQEPENDSDRQLVSYEVFRRLNTGGIALEAQEIRNAVFPGKLNDLICELADNQFMKQQLKTRKSDKGYEKMKDHEYVLRFFTLSKYGDQTFTDQRAMMDRYMQDNMQISDERIDELRKLYTKMQQRAEQLFNTCAFRRWNNEKGEWRDQQNTAIYDAQSMALMSFTDEEFDKLKDKKEEAIAAFRDLFKDEAFLKSINSAISSKNSYNTRLSKTKEVLRALL